jgi:hypothetical protein
MSTKSEYVTADQIAEVSGLTTKHVRRMMGRANGAGPFVRPNWFGVRMKLVVGECGLEAEFATLPEHIQQAFREAECMRDQLELPLPPDGTN